MTMATPEPASLQRPGRDAIVIAHRGASAQVPENTLESFEAAWAASARWVEADTQPTVDGVPVILHDDDVDRTTNGSGAVRGYSATALARLRILGLPAARVPELTALLELLAPGRQLLLEIKGEHSAEQIGALLHHCHSSGHDDRVFLQSFEVAALEHVRNFEPHRPIGLLVERLDADPLARCRALGVTAYNPSCRGVIDRPDVVTVLRAAGISVAVWTSDDSAEWELLTAAGVDAIITNTPRELLAWQRARAGNRE